MQNNSSPISSMLLLAFIAIACAQTQEFKLKADRRSVIIRAVGFTVKIVERGFVTFKTFLKKKTKLSH